MRQIGLADQFGRSVQLIRSNDSPFTVSHLYISWKRINAPILKGMITCKAHIRKMTLLCVISKIHTVKNHSWSRFIYIIIQLAPMSKPFAKSPTIFGWVRRWRLARLMILLLGQIQNWFKFTDPGRSKELLRLSRGKLNRLVQFESLVRTLYWSTLVGQGHLLTSEFF